MAFVLVFVIAMLVVPVMMDIERHGSDNILRRSGQDILRFRWVVASRQVLYGFTRFVTAVVSAAIVGYLLIRLVQYILNALFR